MLTSFSVGHNAIEKMGKWPRLPFPAAATEPAECRTHSIILPAIQGIDNIKTYHRGTASSSKTEQIRRATPGTFNVPDPSKLQRNLPDLGYHDHHGMLNTA